MAAFEVIALDTATPQLRAPGASDTYTFPRAVEMPLGTANGVLYLNGSKVVTSGSGLTFDSSGNLGLGVVPSAWVSNRRVLEIGGGAAALALNGSAAVSEIFANAIRDTGGAYRYFANGPASYVDFNNSSAGGWSWSIAPSWDGTGSNVISFTQAMTLGASGNLGIGTTSPSGITAGYTTVDIRGASGGGIRTGKASAESGLWYTDATQGWFGTVSNIPQVFYTNNTERSRIPSAGGMVVGTAALATTATDGFLYVPTCAGTPTGTPTTQTGTAPIVVNTTNNKLYFYSGGQWRDAGP